MTLRPSLPAITPGFAFAALIGAVATAALPSLPNMAALAIIGILGVLLCLFVPLRWAGAFLLGACWLLWAADARLQARLPASMAAQDFLINGRVEGLPAQEPELVRFDFRVIDAPPEASLLRGELLRVAWYRSNERIDAGSEWQLLLRLKPPRGVRNPGGFDFERWALQRGLAATGYVRESPENHELQGAAGIDAVRADLAATIWTTMGGSGPLHRESRYLRALAVADTRGLDEQDWEVLRATGLSHLIAISGLHVGLVAGFAALLVRLLYRLLPGLGLRLPVPISAALAALGGASGYAALAGFGLPTLRTVAMLAAVVLAVLARRAQSTWQAYGIAILALLLFDPLGILGAGFWLSFAGVAWLLWCLPGSERATPRWQQWLQVQWVASLALLPLTVWFFGQASLLGFAVNLLAVPWVTLVVVPLDLVASAALLAQQAWLAEPLLSLAAWAMNTPMQWLADSPSWPMARLFLPEPDRISLLLALLGAAILLLPRGVPGKALGGILLLPLFWPRIDKPELGSLDVHVLDVGQGLAVLLRTANHSLLYDTGPRFGSGLDMGEAAVVPAMRALGIKDLDRLLVSHGDADHAGGMHAVLRAFPADLSSSATQQMPRARACQRGEAWQWDGVEFAILHPPEHFPYLRNESSCVLQVRVGDTALLLPGDISAQIESRLLREYADSLQSEVILVPHHGSASSSSAGFVQAVNPMLAIVSAGHLNRFQHPRAEVVSAWSAEGAQVFNTTDTGMLSFRLDSTGVSLPMSLRRTTNRLWSAPLDE